MTTTRNFLFLLGLLAACKGGGNKAASVELFGKKPIPPGDLTKVTPGMTQAQFKAAFPKAYKTPNQSGSPSLSIDSGYADVAYKVGFYSDVDKVANITVEVPKDVAAKLESVWGKPTEKGHFGPSWQNDADGYRVEVWEMGRRADVRFEPFTPLSPAYFGSKPAPFDTFAKLKLGMSRDEVKAAAPEIDFAPKGGGSYTPNKGKAEGVKIDVRFTYDTDKLDAIEVSMPARGAEMLSKAWGPGKTGKTREADARPCTVWELADKSMQIELLPSGESSTLTFFAPTTQGFCDAS